MKKLLLLAFILIISVSLVGCAAGQSTPSAGATNSASGKYQKISPEDVKKMMDDGDAITIVDVRTAGEFNSAHLKGAINIPVESILSGKPAELQDLNAKIIVYCRTGARSEVAAKELIKQGYTDVYDMGGLSGWPYETVADESPATAASAGGIMSAFKSTDLNGSPVDQTIFGGKKLTMVNIWATFCGPCLEEMPDLGKLNAQYADKGFQIVGIVIDVADSDGNANPDMVDTAREIIGKTGADYLHILPSSDLAGLLGQVSAVPTTIFVDESGNQVGEAYVGAQESSEWARIIDSLLNEVG